jgi:hypothetical protein
MHRTPKAVFFLIPQKIRALSLWRALLVKLDYLGQRLVRHLAMNALKGDLWNVQ